ncbi:hypothetical protein [Shewanella sp. NIFS-20-20]|uniref:hypothetical protein n=1 Tax=Shewanella sp. NIFS-20-20 TaxID=2853806 RepID=UPI001C460DC6|nr:hypothetical protein [Shewanella sp. NIFS-20-20]MBV7315072.1 hypothetical protein [Shewanella sp. NIFS-20-20]
MAAMTIHCERLKNTKKSMKTTSNDDIAPRVAFHDAGSKRRLNGCDFFKQEIFLSLRLSIAVLNFRQCDWRKGILANNINLSDLLADTLHAVLRSL